MSQVEFDRCVPLVEAAALVSMHPQTLRAAYRRRELDVVRMTRAGSSRPKVYVRLSALDKWLRRATIPASRVREA